MLSTVIKTIIIENVINQFFDKLNRNLTTLSKESVEQFVRDLFHAHELTIINYELGEGHAVKHAAVLDVTDTYLDILDGKFIEYEFIASDGQDLHDIMILL